MVDPENDMSDRRVQIKREHAGKMPAPMDGATNLRAEPRITYTLPKRSICFVSHLTSKTILRDLDMGQL